jgi:phosphate transport system permease protein
VPTGVLGIALAPATGALFDSEVTRVWVWFLASEALFDVSAGKMPPQFTGAGSLDQRWSWLRARELLIQYSLVACALLSIATTAFIIYILLVETWAFFQQVSLAQFLFDTRWAPQYPGNRRFGIWPLIAGTFMVAGIALSIGIPVGLGSAIYLSEYAQPRFRNMIKPVLEILAGIPTVVFGYFGLVIITPYLIKPLAKALLGMDVDTMNALSAGIVVGIMIIPTISSLSEDVLRSVPRGLREAAYALGSTRFDVSVRVVVPAALSGILASFLLAMARAVGETMAVVIAGGQNPRLTANPFKQIESMTAYIVNISLGEAAAGSIEELSLYAVAMTLFLITLSTNIAAQFILRRFREVYQ